jgi:hypothetical protein
MRWILVVAILAILLDTALAERDPDIPWDPPAQYQHRYTGELGIYRSHSREEVMAICGPGTYACSFRDDTKCAIVAPLPGTSLLNGRTLSNHGYYNILRHELGHCNGWPGDHPA